jgi:chemotaxis protein CheX
MAETLSPEGKLDLAAVAKLHGDLMAAQGKDITLDMSGVTQIGALCLQTCIAAARAAKEAGHGFELVNVPETVADHIQIMGCDAQNLAGDTHDA